MAVQLDTLVDLLYEASLVPERWPRALEGLAAVADAALASIFAFDGTVLRWVGTPAANALIADYKTVERMIPNERIARALRSNRTDFITDYDWFAPAELEQEPFYRDFLRPRGFGWVAATKIEPPTGDIIFFSAERRFSRGPVEAACIRRLNRLRPHIARAGLVAARLQFERARAMAEVLAMMGIPAAVLGGRGTLLVANDLFAGFIPAVCQDRRHRLVFMDADADRLFAEVVASGSAGIASRSIAVRATEFEGAFVAHVLPLRGDARDIFISGQYILAITSVNANDRVGALVLQALFDLTPAEAMVARGVAEQMSVAQIAVQLGHTTSTVRTRLKSVMNKTGTHRQAELAALLAGLHVPATSAGGQPPLLQQRLREQGRPS